MLDPKATISRPDAKRFDTSMVIKADQFRTWHLNHVDTKVSTGEVLLGMLNLRGADALRDLAQLIVQQHRPTDLLALPASWRLKAKRAIQPQASLAEPVTLPASATAAEPVKKKLVCMTCGAKISFAEGRFCWSNEKQADREAIRDRPAT